MRSYAGSSQAGKVGSVAGPAAGSRLAHTRPNRSATGKVASRMRAVGTAPGSDGMARHAPSGPKRKPW